jgi:hypothetical protein
VIILVQKERLKFIAKGFSQEGTYSMRMKSITRKAHRLFLIMACILCCGLLNLGLLQQAHCAPAYQISGFYLGATPDDVGVTVEIDPEQEEKYYEVETGGVRLFL